MAVTGTIALSTNGAVSVDATITNATGITFATSGVGHNLTATATTGAIAQSGTVTVGNNASFTTTLANQAMTLNALAVTGTIALSTNGAVSADATITNATGITFATSGVGHKLTATATTGSITQGGTVTVGNNASFTTSQASQTITLNALAVTGLVALSTNGVGSNAAVTNANGLDLGPVTVGGSFSGTATAGNITNTGGIINVTGNSTFTAASGASIAVDFAGNVFTGTVTFVASTGNLANVRVLDTTALVLQVLTITGNLWVQANGITQSGVVTVGGTATFTASPANSTITLASLAVTGQSTCTPAARGRCHHQRHPGHPGGFRSSGAISQ